MIRIGCCGWPVAQSRYQERFGAVEINATFDRAPRRATVERWRENSPADFVFSVRASRLITHSATSPTYEKKPARISPKELLRCGHFRPSDEVADAWRETEAAARSMEASFVVFQTPASFYPNADHLRDFYRFFKNARRDGLRFVWEPRGESWRPEMIQKVCRDLQLVHAVDPMIAEPVFGATLYFRLHGRHQGGKIDPAHGYTDAELRHLLERCGDRSAFVFFNNVTMWRDALRLESMARPDAARLRTSYVRDLRGF